MIVYNITCSVDKDVAEEWVSWMKDNHMPAKMLKVLTHEDEKTFSFAVQYHTNSLTDVEDFFVIEDELHKRYGERVLTYATLLEEI